MNKCFRKKINNLIKKKTYFKNLKDNKKYKSFFYQHNTCSDYFYLFVFIDNNHIIREIFYFGKGCSFSILGFEVLIPIFLNSDEKKYKFKKNEILKYFENKKYNSNVINKNNINFFSLAKTFNLRLNCFLILFNFDFLKKIL